MSPFDPNATGVPMQMQFNPAGQPQFGQPQQSQQPQQPPVGVVPVQSSASAGDLSFLNAVVAADEQASTVIPTYIMPGRVLVKVERFVPSDGADMKKYSFSLQGQTYPGQLSTWQDRTTGAMRGAARLDLKLTCVDTQFEGGKYNNRSIPFVQVDTMERNGSCTMQELYKAIKGHKLANATMLQLLMAVYQELAAGPIVCAEVQIAASYEDGLAKDKKTGAIKKKADGTDMKQYTEVIGLGLATRNADGSYTFPESHASLPGKQLRWGNVVTTFWPRAILGR